MYTISQLNQSTQKDFVTALGAVFEDTPSIAAQTWFKRPFKDVAQLHQIMVEVVQGLDHQEQLALIKAHPDLGSRAKMADASVKEQAGVGLDRLTPSEYTKFCTLNQRYKHKFNFPFIVAVKNHTKDSILENFESRLQHSPTQERERAIAEITAIAKFRLLTLVE